jgi:tRNA threonylcarbamoyladenosine biosynthesis protein TsaE
LVGPLGAGKTTFVQGLARGLGVAELSEVLSPTYTLVNEYPTRPKEKIRRLVHIDLYRLADGAKAEALGIDEYLHRADAVVAVEWADSQPQLFGPETIWVRFVGAGERTIEIEGPGLDGPHTASL